MCIYCAVNKDVNIAFHLVMRNKYKLLQIKDINYDEVGSHLRLSRQEY